MEKNLSIRSRFGRDSGVVEAIIDRLAQNGIHIKRVDVYNSLGARKKKVRHREAVIAAYRYFDRNWEKLKEEKLKKIAGEV